MTARDALHRHARAAVWTIHVKAVLVFVHVGSFRGVGVHPVLERGRREQRVAATRARHIVGRQHRSSAAWNAWLGIKDAARAMPCGANSVAAQAPRGLLAQLVLAAALLQPFLAAPLALRRGNRQVDAPAPVAPIGDHDFPMLALEAELAPQAAAGVAHGRIGKPLRLCKAACNERLARAGVLVGAGGLPPLDAAGPGGAAPDRDVRLGAFAHGSYDIGGSLRVDYASSQNFVRRARFGTWR